MDDFITDIDEEVSPDEQQFIRNLKTKIEGDKEDIVESKLKYPVTDENGKLICQECGKSFHSITTTHLDTHKMSLQEYKNKYGTTTVPDRIRERLSASLRATRNSMFKDRLNKPPEKEVEIESPIEDIDDIRFDHQYSQTIEDIKDIAIVGKVEPTYAKNELAYHIDELFNNKYVTKPDYLIEEYSGSGSFPGSSHLICSFISDIAIIDKKIAFFFPDTFWHNNDYINSAFKYKTLKDQGWTIIEIEGNHPTLNTIKDKLVESNLLK